MTYVRDPRAVPCTGGTLGAERVEAIRLKWLDFDNMNPVVCDKYCC